MTSKTYFLAEAPDDLGALDHALKTASGSVAWITFDLDEMALDVALTAELSEAEDAAIMAVLNGPPPPKPVSRKMAVKISDRVSPLREVKALWR